MLRGSLCLIECAQLLPHAQRPRNVKGQHGKQLKEAENFKREGNEAYVQREWENAISLYQEALLELPGLKSQQQANIRTECLEAQGEATVEPSPAIKKARSVLHANLGAVYLKLEQWQEASDACTNGDTIPVPA